MHFVPFTAKTRMSGVDYEGVCIRKGAADAIKKHVEALGGHFSLQCQEVVDQIARQGGTPLVVSKNEKVMGVIHLKDIIKQGVKEKFADLRKMGIKTIMITGDNPLTAAAIAAEAGVDDFLAEATPETKLQLIRDYQAQGHLVAMTGDGTNDAPALAQADVAVAMNTGTQAAKEAGNMVDLDSSPTKLIQIVQIGKQLLMTRGIADDVFHRQRCGEIFCDYSGNVCRLISRTSGFEYHAASQSGKRDFLSDSLQRADHCRFNSFSTKRRPLPRGSGQ